METELIQEKEQVMKFKVGDRVKVDYKRGNKLVGTVDKIDLCCTSEPPLPYRIKIDKDYHVWRKEKDLELIQPEIQEPVPGKFYRTRSGDKYFYVGKSKNGRFIYEFEEERCISYTNPFICSLNTTNVNDIVGEWVDAPESQKDEVTLPDVEIKRWAVVGKIDVTDNAGDLLKRGEYLCGYDSADDAKNDLKGWSNKDWYEIVELTGTLPERKVGK